MGLCVTVTVAGGVATLNVVDPVPADLSTCAYYLPSGPEGIAAATWWQSSLFAITPSDGGLLAIAIIAVWVVGWGVRQYLRALNV